jgi:hypothetical protein
MAPDIHRLKAMGFSLAGRWYFSEGTPDYELDKKLSASRNVLYAFVANDQVMYIGKTTQPLRARIENYKYATRSTNIKIKKNIVDRLNHGLNVEILVLPDNGLLHYGGFHVNLAAGLEDSLIRDLRPPWNGGKKESPNETLAPLESKSDLIE